MKLVEAILNGASLDHVRDSLSRAGVDGMTVTAVHSLRARRSQAETPEGGAIRVTSEPRVRVEIVLEDGRLNALLYELLRTTRTGRLTDGQIYVLPVGDAVRIRTSERGEDAL